jgi:hypothetical protein
MPKRIQRKRTKGWKMPEGAVYVGRPTKWGNPFTMLDGFRMAGSPQSEVKQRSLFAMVEAFRKLATQKTIHDSAWCSDLRGKDLACWCALGQPCHADVLLEIANAE